MAMKFPSALDSSDCYPSYKCQPGPVWKRVGRVLLDNLLTEQSQLQRSSIEREVTDFWIVWSYVESFPRHPIEESSSGFAKHSKAADNHFGEVAQILEDNPSIGMSARSLLRNNAALIIALSQVFETRTLRPGNNRTLQPNVVEDVLLLMAQFAKVASDEFRRDLDAAAEFIVALKGMTIETLAGHLGIALEKASLSGQQAGG